MVLFGKDVTMNPVHPNTYTYRRTVRYSDCDASRNHYTPRAIDYAVEAVEGWYENVLGVSWTDLLRRRDLEVHFGHVGCEFRKTLTAGEVVQARVGITGVEGSDIMFSVSGRNDAGELCFLSHLMACFVERKRFEPIPIPSEYHERIENYRACCAETDPIAKDTGRKEHVEQCVSFPLTTSSNDVPFILQRRVVYGECAASGSIYAPRVFDYLLDAVGEWYGKFLGISWLEQNSRKIGQPFLSVTCDYLKPMVAGQLIATAVTVSRLGKSSIAYAVAGFDDKGVQYFDAQLTACYSIEENGGLKATPFPDEIRERILAYKGACDGCRHSE